MRILVCGSRDYADVDAVFRALDKAHAHAPITVIVHGDCSGADQLADQWAKKNSVSCWRFPAQWSDGPSAGPARNARMLIEANPQGVIAFPGGTGTANMIKLARAAKLPIWRPYGG